MSERFFKTLLIISTLAPQTAFAQGDPNPSEIKIRRFDFTGTGCPANSVAYDISEDGEGITILFDAYAVEKTPGTSARERKSCDLRIAMTTPPGWSFALFSLMFRGYADLDKNAVGTQNVNYSFGGSSTRVKLGKINIDGAFKDDYERLDTLPLNTLQWSPCRNRTQVFDLETSIAITAKEGVSGYMTVDSLDGEISQQYELTITTA